MAAKTHGKSKSRAFKAWDNMITRCTRPSCRQWEDYGGRGITVCERWRKFENFYEDMGDPPDGMSLDRENNDLGYDKNNCRWATRQVQDRNTRRNHLLMIDGQTKCLTDWCKEYGLLVPVVRKRLKYMTPKEALTTPLDESKRRYK